MLPRSRAGSGGLLLLVLLAWRPAAAGQLWLVSAGVERYDDATIAPVRYAAGDARELARVLAERGVPADHLAVLTSEDSGERRADKSRLLAALERLPELAGPDDLVVFYFAGHGVELNGVQFLLTAETRRKVIDETALPFSAVTKALGGLRAKNVVFIADACRTGVEAGRGNERAKLPEGLARAMRPALQRAAPQATIVSLTACAPGQQAWGMPSREHGVFTWFLLEGLRGQAAAADGTVTVASLAAYARGQVTSYTERQGLPAQTVLLDPDGASAVLVASRPAGPGAVRPVTVEATLRITSRPAGATVVVDGREVGRTPFTGQLAVPDGRSLTCRVELRLAGHGTRAADVPLAPGAQQEWTDVDLVPTGAVQAAPVAGHEGLPAAPTAFRIDGADKATVLTREVHARLLHLYAVRTGVTQGPQPLAVADVTESSPAYGALGWLCKAGILDPFEDGQFRPRATVSRYELAMTVLRLGAAVVDVLAPRLQRQWCEQLQREGAAGGRGVFEDVPFDHWSYSALERLYAAGVVTGTANGTFAGAQAATVADDKYALNRLWRLIENGLPTKADVQRDLAQRERR